MGKSAGDAPSPDPNIGKASLLSAETGKEWLGFAKDSYKQSMERQKGLDALVKEVQTLQLDTGKSQLGWAKEDRERYKKIFQPIEDKFIKEASTYGDAAHQQAAAAEAGADVAQAGAAARGTARRETAALGITPGSGRWAGMERSGELANTAMTAGAKNTARKAQRDKGLAMQADVVNLGRGLPAQSAQAASIGLTGAGNAGQLGIANQQMSLAPAQQMNVGYQGYMGGLNQQAQIGTNLYGLELEKWRTQTEQDSAGMAGFGKFLGTVAGAAIPLMSDKNVKKNIKPVAEGKSLKAVKGMPVKSFDYKEGAGDGGTGHVGTMAQDYKRETGQGDGKTIPLQDLVGITMKAVQELDKKVDKLGGQLGIGDGKPQARRASQTGRGGTATKKTVYKAPQRPSQQLGIG